MAWDVTHVGCITSLIVTTFFLYEGHCKCISTSETRLCGDSCSGSRFCSVPSSCPQECTYCKTGYYGPHCERPCKGKSNCLHDNCVLLPSGRALNCSEGCKAGWRGLSCNTNCKHPCLVCDRYSGDCVGTCRDGYFGLGCSERCHEHCVKCHNESGNCTGACVFGYYGGNCFQTCPDDCLQCDSESGKCLNSESYMNRENVTYYENSAITEQSTEDITGQVKRESVYIQEVSDDQRSKYRSFFTIMMMCGVLACIAVLVVVTISILIFKRKRHNRRHSQPIKNSANRTKPLALPEADHIYDEIGDNPQERPLNLSGDYITPTSRNSSYSSTKTQTDCYISAVLHSPPKQNTINHMLFINTEEESF